MKPEIQKVIERFKSKQWTVHEAANLLAEQPWHAIGRVTYWIDEYTCVLSHEPMMDKWVRRIIDECEMSVGPVLLESIEIGPGLFFLVEQYRECPGEQRVPVDKFKGRVGKKNMDRALEEMELLYDCGFWHYYSHLGTGHWFVFLPSGTFVLNRWSVCLSLDYCDGEPLDELLTDVRDVLYPFVE